MIIKVRENEPFEVAMRRFKRAIEKTGLLTELQPVDAGILFDGVSTLGTGTKGSFRGTGKPKPVKKPASDQPAR